MQFGILEVLASILIFFIIIKLVVILVSPKAWMEFARKVYVKPQVTSAISFILALVVLYFLLSSGITIVHILAVTLFIVLVIVVGMAKYADALIDWAIAQDLNNILKEQWFYTLVWLALIIWGIQAIYFN